MSNRQLAELMADATFHYPEQMRKLPVMLAYLYQNDLRLDDISVHVSGVAAPMRLSAFDEKLLKVNGKGGADANAGE